MHRTPIFVVFGACCLFLGFAAGCWLFSHDRSGQVGDVVTMVWGDGKYGESFYGAQVWVEPVGSRFTVRARVHIGHGNSMYQDCGILGTEDTFPEAVRKWGKVDWQPDGLHIGSYFLPRAQMEAHR